MDKRLSKQWTTMQIGTHMRMWETHKTNNTHCQFSNETNWFSCMLFWNLILCITVIRIWHCRPHCLEFLSTWKRGREERDASPGETPSYRVSKPTADRLTEAARHVAVVVNIAKHHVMELSLGRNPKYINPPICHHKVAAEVSFGIAPPYRSQHQQRRWRPD